MKILAALLIEKMMSAEAVPWPSTEASDISVELESDALNQKIEQKIGQKTKKAINQNCA